MTNGYHDHLVAYIERQRWFAGKGRSFSIEHIEPLPWLSEGDPAVRDEILTVVYDDGSTDSYQFPVAYRDWADPELAHALVGELDHPQLGPVCMYDAVYLKEADDLFLEGFLDDAKTDGMAFRVVEGCPLPAEGTIGSVMTAEQSNTSIAYGDDAILKLFRRISPGGNPDIEIHDALTRLGSEHVAPLIGWIEGRWSDVDGLSHDGHLGMLQEFLRTATDGWDLALTSVRDLLVEADLHADEVGGDFAGEAERLGEATAIVHRELAEVFDTGTLGPDQLVALADSIGSRLDAALVVVPALAEFATALGHRFAAIVGLPGAPVQRVHGDLHLGQTLRTVKGWKLIDFEGEPAKPLAERVRLESPLRDLAGMLRSFDYAAGSTLHGFGFAQQLVYRAHEWSDRNKSAFLLGYTNESRAELGAHQSLLRAYEADKAVYEAVYETRNRPGWVDIPLQAIERMASEVE
ncbi:MAG: maltokinase N-terminal cap-like domain-containing protein [Nocardioidaceae bacterium]